MGEVWEEIEVPGPERIRRLRVPGGWLYQVELLLDVTSTAHGAPRMSMQGWHPPVFVKA